MNKSEQINELAAALATAQGQIKNAVKDSQNPFFKSAYANLASVRGVIQAPFAENGLSVTQLLGNDAYGVTVETVLLHKSGQWLSGVVSVRPVKDDPQALGSAVTYARRYSLSAVAGVASETDDDGESAMGRETKTEPLPSRFYSVSAQVAKPVATASVTPVEPPVVAAPLEASRVIDGKVVREVKTPEGKQSRVTLFGDETVYLLGKGETAPKAGETITADCTLKETSSGVAYYELSNCIPF